MNTVYKFSQAEYLFFNRERTVAVCAKKTICLP